METSQAVESDKELDFLYARMRAAGLRPLWTQRGDLMPESPTPSAEPQLWRWDDVFALATRAGELVPVGRGGERRAIALANRGLAGQPFATPILWAAIQYLGPREVAPAHRHSQEAFRFILEGEGVWTLVNGDPVAMHRGDVLLTPAWAWHEHANTGDQAMVWLDGLDIPLVGALDAGFFEFGPDEPAEMEFPEVSRSERLWAHPGLCPVSAIDQRQSPLMAYRWETSDRALAAQLDLFDEGHTGVIGPGHAAVRVVNPTTGRDALAAIRIEMHRLRAGATTETIRTVGSAVWQVFAGEIALTVGSEDHALSKGDLFSVPSWYGLRLEAISEVDLFCFSDAPVYEQLGLARSRRGK